MLDYAVLLTPRTEYDTIVGWSALSADHAVLLAPRTGLHAVAAWPAPWDGDNQPHSIARPSHTARFGSRVACVRLRCFARTSYGVRQVGRVASIVG
jgi:hypothetical protein